MCFYLFLHNNNPNCYEIAIKLLTELKSTTLDNEKFTLMIDMLIEGKSMKEINYQLNPNSYRDNLYQNISYHYRINMDGKVGVDFNIFIYNI